MTRTDRPRLLAAALALSLAAVGAQAQTRGSSSTPTPLPGLGGRVALIPAVSAGSGLVASQGALALTPLPGITLAGPAAASGGPIPVLPTSQAPAMAPTLALPSGLDAAPIVNAAPEDARHGGPSGLDAAPAGKVIPKAVRDGGPSGLDAAPIVNAVPEDARHGGPSGLDAAPAGKIPAAVPSAETQASEAGALFDQSGANPAGSLLPDLIPEWPGKTGDTVRINGHSYVLADKLGEGTGAWVYRVQGWPLVVKLIYPDLAEVPVFGSEVPALTDLGRTQIPHARMRDHSADGMVIVKDLVEGELIYDLAERQGGLGPTQVSSLVDLAADLIASEHTADLNLGNLVWDAKRHTWILIDAGGYGPGPAWGVLGQLLSPSRTSVTRIDPSAFLEALRRRLGADSPAWRRVLETPTVEPHKALVRRFLPAHD